MTIPHDYAKLAERLAQYEPLTDADILMGIRSTVTPSLGIDAYCIGLSAHSLGVNENEFKPA